MYSQNVPRDRRYCRAQMQCLMFDRSGAYCDVCRDAVEEIIDLYSRAGP